MLLTGRFIDAAMAADWGLINRAVPADRLDAEVRTLVEDLATLSPLAIRMGKQGFYRQIEERQEVAYELMSQAIAENAVTKDGQEGINAFLEKRKPVWRGK
jgi:enoyl-CoA hydratase/carnithine racemase